MTGQNKIKIIILSGIALAATFSMFLIIFIWLGFGEAPDKPDSRLPSEIIKDDFPEIDPDLVFTEDLVAKSDDIESQIDTIGNKEGLELTNDISNVIISNVMTRLMNFNAHDAISYLDTELAKYNLDSDAESFVKIDNLYRDLSKMVQVNYALQNGEEEIVYDIIKNIEQPLVHLISTLSLDREQRLPLIGSVESLNPVFDGGISLETPLIQSNYDVMTAYDVLEVAIIPFEIEGNQLIADYLYTTNGLILYRIYEKSEGSTHYLTIKEWEEMMNISNTSSEEEKEVTNEN